VETYVPWNLHEPRRGEFDFGNGTNDFSEFLNVRRYVEIAKEEDLLVLFRPGPYICSEWDFGGSLFEIMIMYIMPIVFFI
jgi:beta-galactosidase